MKGDGTGNNDSSPIDAQRQRKFFRSMVRAMGILSLAVLGPTIPFFGVLLYLKRSHPLPGEWNGLAMIPLTLAGGLIALGMLACIFVVIQRLVIQRIERSSPDKRRRDER